MIKAVFLDFFDTLVRWHPPAEQIQRQASAAEGVDVHAAAVLRAYPMANAFMDAENARKPITRRSATEREAFFAEYERRLLSAAGVEVPHEVAGRVWARVQSTPKGFALYDDAMPTIEALASGGLTVGVLSNLGPELGRYVGELGLDAYVRVIVSSGEAGVSKPHAAFFEAALARAGVRGQDAVHVGDSYEADYLGARNAGLHALLLVRPGNAAPGAVGAADVVDSLSDVVPRLQRVGLMEEYSTQRRNGRQDSKPED